MTHANRTLTWAQVVSNVLRTQEKGISHITPDANTPETDTHEEFLLNPNWIGTMGWGWIHKDADALKWVPNSGTRRQYIPRLVDTLTVSGSEQVFRMPEANAI